MISRDRRGVEEKHLLIFALHILNKLPKTLCVYLTEWMEVEKCCQCCFKAIFVFHMLSFLPPFCDAAHLPLTRLWDAE